MKMLIKKIIVLALIMQSGYFSQSQNLILNSSCDDPLAGGNIPNWQDMNGTGWTQRTSAPDPYNGIAYFFAGAGANARLTQEINIDLYKCLIDAGNQQFRFTGFVRAFNQSPSDESNIIIEFFNSGNVLLTAYHFGPYNQTEIWKKIDSLFAVPAGARKVLITLNSIRHNGINNDGYYDELSLTPATVNSELPQIRIDTTICTGQTFLGHSVSGIYVDTIATSSGCLTVRTLNLTVTPVILSNTAVTVCRSQLPYNWNSQTLHTAGIYSSSFVTGSGCDSTAVLQLTVLDKPAPYLGEDKTLCNGDRYKISPGTFATYLWQDLSSLDHYIVTQPGIYTVEVTNQCGSNQDQIVIEMNDCNVYFPNVFTPNNDTKNDLFKVLNYTSDYFTLIVYNRYGQKVFETTDYSKGWDGNFSGKPQPAGTYTYLCKYKKFNIVNEIKGTVILLR